MSNRQIQIDFSAIKDIADRGVRRTSVFMGIGINAILDKAHLDYDLTKITQLQIVPSNVSDDTHKHFKDEFSVWIVGNGLRELIETFKVFLDNLHCNCLLMGHNKGVVSDEDAKAWNKKFPTEGLPNKLTFLKDRFNVSPKYSDYLKTINKARNCLTHRRGIVSIEDCNNNNSLKINWLGMDIFIHEPSGNRTLINEIPEDGLLLREGGNVMLQFVERERNVNSGEGIRFTPRELAEICHYFLMESGNTIKTAIEYAKGIGIPFAESEQQ